ncbi:insoluble matrix shell protein 6-like [Mercenaria mercenaria]|uniref:insoluble matrix shell protein 6-like n=1 Tax=Mercenaria mercenaria TaxID=6596 RepID=UPI00234E7CFE|nr:insoluble matrix shell protein 6-like [Mercenaria mercenaria]
MKAILILCLCIVAVHSRAGRRDRPDFDCGRWCRSDGYKPVCSTENKNYDNACYLECNWKYKECDGRCPCYRPSIPDRPDPRGPFCYCSKYDPVCTNEGTVDCESKAKCEGKYVFYDSPCMD